MRLGIAVSRNDVRAVAVSGQRIVWAAERHLAEPGDLGRSLAELAAEPTRGIRRVRTVVETDLCAVKLLAMPQVTIARLKQAVSLQPHRWFLRGATPLATDAVWANKGVALVAAVEAGLLEEIAQGLAQAGLSNEWTSPALPAVAEILGDGSHSRVAGTLLERTEVVGRVIRSIRRLLLPTQDVPAATIPALATLGERGPGFLAAYAAARTRPRLILLPGSVAQTRRRKERRNLVAGLAVGLGVWLTAGGIYALRLHTRATAARETVVAMQPAVEAVRRAQNEITKIQAALRTMSAIQANRSSDVRLLALLTRTLPDSTYLVSLTRDPGRTVHVTGYNARAGAATERIRKVGEAKGWLAEGPPVQDMRDGVNWERFTGRFEWRTGERQ